MRNIELREISKKDVRSCNNCSARNYKSSLSYESKVVDKLYELQVSSMCICLCRDCLEDLQNIVGNFLTDHPTEKGGVQE